METFESDYFLDITSHVCPLTFVRAKLLIERMARGQTAEIRLNPGEPLDNVPRSLAELGHTILAAAPEDPAAPDGPHLVRVRKE